MDHYKPNILLHSKPNSLEKVLISSIAIPFQFLHKLKLVNFNNTYAVKLIQLSNTFLIQKTHFIHIHQD